ncbi:hypothetical protein FB595_1661 [Sphingobium sp. AEW010]|nr:hypothetical protein FB595_1661 [Sphingobium sp. AEW010]TWD15083.1 hypothetical protein FB596_1671 [Sphingobium sp. AEW013]TWD18934.1 hypothetical protein FB594_1676 [Sphingobium sp. AEW001]
MTARCPCSHLLKGRELSYSDAGNKAAFRRRLQNTVTLVGFVGNNPAFNLGCGVA